MAATCKAAWPAKRSGEKGGKDCCWWLGSKLPVTYIFLRICLLFQIFFQSDFVLFRFCCFRFCPPSDLIFSEFVVFRHGQDTSRSEFLFLKFVCVWRDTDSKNTKIQKRGVEEQQPRRRQGKRNEEEKENRGQGKRKTKKNIKNGVTPKPKT